MSDLIDTTEMYLRTIFELEEAGVVPLRARISERLGHSGPTVSETVARMQRDGLVSVEGDRHLELSPVGRRQAESVMRKHRLAECLLVEVVGLPLELVHEEACRWEHVMSDAVEERLISVLAESNRSPFGNPVPGRSAEAASGQPLRDLATALQGGAQQLVRVVRYSEQVQSDLALMAAVNAHELLPGALVAANALTSGGFQLGELPVTLEQAGHIYVSAA